MFQQSLFYDYQNFIERSPLYRKYHLLFSYLDRFEIKLNDNSGPGRNGQPSIAYLKSFIIKHFEEIKSVPELVRYLKSHPVLTDMCGFRGGNVSDSSCFYRFLSRTLNSQLQDIFHQVAKQLIEEKVITTDVLVADSKPVKANTRENNPKNPNRNYTNKNRKPKRNPAAALNYYSYLKQPGDGKRTYSMFWGYRTHVIVSKEGVPLVEETCPVDTGDSKVGLRLLKKLKRIYGQKKKRVYIADSAYDVREIYDFIVEKMKSTPYIPINKRNTKERLFGDNDCPLCAAGLEMKFASISPDKKRVRQKFRCPIKSATLKEKKQVPEFCPVNHPRFSEGAAYGCTAYIDITDDPRSRVNRSSNAFKIQYKERVIVERYFSRLGDREAEQTTHYNLRSVKNQMTIAHFSLLLLAGAAAIEMGEPDKIRCFKSFADSPPKLKKTA